MENLSEKIRHLANQWRKMSWDAVTGGFSTTIHISVDGLGNLLRLRLTPGQAGDSPQAAALLDELDAEAVIADRAYDTNALREQLADQGVEVVIPPHPNRKEPADYDRHRYKERHLVECFINKTKHYRRVFSRFEKLANRYLGFVQFASVLIWLR
jgi:transposase